MLLRFGKMEDVTTDIVRAIKDNGDEVEEVFFQKEVRHSATARVTNRVADPTENAAVLHGRVDDRAQPPRGAQKGRCQARHVRSGAAQ